MLKAWEVVVYAPQLGHEFRLHARFDDFGNGINGLLGYGGFLRWMSVQFDFDQSFRVFEIRSQTLENGITSGGVRVD